MTTEVKLDMDVFDFNQPIIDADGNPVMDANMSEVQAVRSRRLALVLNNRNAPLEEQKKAFEELEVLKKATMRSIALGLVCCVALRAPDEKADGKEIIRKEKLAQLIQGSPDEETFGILPRGKLKSEKKTLILKCVEEIYGASSPLLYVRVYEALEGSLDDEDNE